MSSSTENCKKEVISFSAMASIELISVVLGTMYKAAAVKGLSNFVIIAYCNAIGALVFLPLFFIFHRPGLPSLLSLAIISRFVLLAFIGYSASVCGYKGIYYTSPTIASCISNLLPVFTFFFAIIFRMESLNFGSTRTRAKVIGTLVSVSGALVTILYKGPVIFPTESQASLLLLVRASNTNWVLGCILLIGSCIFCSLAFIIQTQIVKLYPNALAVGAIDSLFVAIVASISGAIVETDINAWTLRTELALPTVILTGLFGSSLVTVVHTWGLNNKGPVYVSIFKPFSIVIAAVMGVTLLGDTLHLGSVIGATIILVGFYAVTWEKIEDQASHTNNIDDKTPLFAT